MTNLKIKNTDDIAEVSLYTPMPVILHGYVIPFLILYISVFYAWLAYWGFNEYFEAGIIALAIVGCIQILVCLFCHWFVGVKCLLTCKKKTRIEDATVLKVIPTPNNGCADVVKLQSSKDLITGKPNYWFEFQKVKFTYDYGDQSFEPVQYPINESISFYNDCKGYQTEEDVQVALSVYGKNKMSIDAQKFGDLFIERATAPFFVFQVFCVALWCLDEYWYYSLFTLFMLVVFECTLVQQQMKNMSEIRAMGNKPYKIMTYRGKKWLSISSDEIIAGDIVSVTRSKNDELIPCDLLLVRGSCIVDESMLTGESVPVMKESIEEVTDDVKLNVEEEGRLHVLSGGTKIVQHTPASKLKEKFKAPDNGCVAYVLRTGFNSSQGRLLKTILYSVKRVTANNLETFMFILFLLIFAVSAASYVWIKGSQDPKRNRYKLFLECTLILTSVVPPELPIELSLAVNSSLLALTKLLVFCTEPFRIPFAGKVDICCFDKTGTLTKDEMIVDGVAGLTLDKSTSSHSLLPVQQCPTNTLQVLACCHSLVQMEQHDIIGDPLEKAILDSVRWTLSRAEVVFPPPSARTHPLKIYYRFYFSSALQRMSVIAGYNKLGSSSDISYVAAVKGSPEIMKERFLDAPRDYDQVYLDLSRRGARVLALGHRELGVLSHQAVRELRRDDIEQGLSFCGFAVISCPLKKDTKSVVKEILNSSHHVTMITGDNPLTACHVGREVRILRKEKITLILTKPNSFDPDWHWQSIDNTVILPWDVDSNLKKLTASHDFCLTGDGLRFLESNKNRLLQRLLPIVRVYARVAPKQKELIVVGLKQLGYGTLMCGDGTNDVGALKQADVGVALLANAPDPVFHTPAISSVPEQATVAEKPSRVLGSRRTGNSGQPSSVTTARASKLASKTGMISGNNNANDKSPFSASNNPHLKAANQKMNNLMNEIETEEKAQIVHLGDASIAAPFTVKMSSIRGVSHIIKQGRCTLVTTLQMFKILALNALILAYSQSVLYLDGVKFSDAQATIQALLLAGCFLFISRSKPLKELSRQRPLANIFNAYTLLTVMLQFSVHFYSLFVLSNAAHQFTHTHTNSSGASLVNETLPSLNTSLINGTASNTTGNSTLGLSDTETDFQPNILNTVVYIISLGMQTTTFAINYKGRPFMESLKDNRPLLVSLLISMGGVMLLASGCVPEAAEQFKIVSLPSELQYLVQKMLILDFFGSFIIDRVLSFILGRSHVKKIVR